MKSPFLEWKLGPDGIRFMEKIKQAWDPNGIMNPGKIFPRPGQRLVLSDD